jgi:hypothetical protein
LRTLELGLQGSQLDPSQRQLLSDAIVQLDGDPPTLLLLRQRGIEGHALEPLLVGANLERGRPILSDVRNECHGHRAARKLRHTRRKLQGELRSVLP